MRIDEGIEHRQRQPADCSGQQTAVLSSHRASRHVPSASLGHYAALSFIVRGKEQRKEERDSPVGAAFPDLSLPALSLSNGSKGSKGSPLSVTTTASI